MERWGRIRCKKRMSGELAKDAEVTMEEVMRRSVLECIDQLSQELIVWSDAMSNILSTFAAIQPHNLFSAVNNSYRKPFQVWPKFLNEMSKEEVTVEIVCLHSHLKAAKLATEEVCIHMDSLAVPSVYCQMGHWKVFAKSGFVHETLLTVCVSVASCERSFPR